MDRDNARKYFAADKFATEQTGIVIEECENGYAKCYFDILPHHLNRNNTLMGGAAYTIADFTAAVAANTEEKTSVSLSGNINYLSVAKGSRVYAEANVIKDGKTIAVTEVNVYDDLGTKIAYAVFNSFNLKKGV
ncbi:MAG: PaaI family thioesterase [Clostridia bacterium]|nr:PaaI family thioesterase [Clostridia bacterium]